MVDPDDHVREVATATPLFDQRVLNLKHNVFLAQLLREKVNIESSSGESYHHIFLLMRLSDAQSSKVCGAKVSPTMCLFLNVMYQEVFETLPTTFFCKRLVRIDLHLRPKFASWRGRSRSYSAF